MPDRLPARRDRGQRLAQLGVELARRDQGAQPVVVDIEEPDRLLDRLLLDDGEAAFAGGRERERDAIGMGGQLDCFRVGRGQRGARTPRLFEEEGRRRRARPSPDSVVVQRITRFTCITPPPIVALTTGRRSLLLRSIVTLPSTA